MNKHLKIVLKSVLYIFLGLISFGVIAGDNIQASILMATITLLVFNFIQFRKLRKEQ